MVEALYPGIYTEEVPSGKVAPAGISTSNGAFVGFTPRGPVNEPEVVVNWTQFASKFGTFDTRTDLPIHVYAYFANGGQRAYINRCVGAGAVKAEDFFTNPVEEEAIEVGDGLTLIFGGTLVHNPVRAEAGALSITWRKAGVAVPAQACNMSPTPNGILLNFAGKLGAAGADTPIVPGTITITDLQGAGADILLTDPAKDGVLVDGGAVTRGYVNYKTGHFTYTAAVAPVIPGDVTYAYTPVGASETLVDDGVTPVGALTSTNASGTITRATGAYTFTIVGAPNAPCDLDIITADYIQDNAAFEVNWEGLDGNDISTRFHGDPNFYDIATATFSRWKLQVWQLDDSGANQLRESFDELSFTSTDPHYLLDIVNNEDTGSDLITIGTPVDAVGPGSLDGLVRTRAIGNGNGVATHFGSSGAIPTIATPFVTDPLEFPVQAGSVTIAYRDAAGIARTITDDGVGGLIGDTVDPAAAAGFNVIDYETGEFAFQVTVAVGTAALATTGSLISITYYKEPSDTYVEDDPTGGTDGTLPLTRNELTNPTLKADREGIYALLKVNEPMNLVVPDALAAASAAKIIMFGDITTECNDSENGRWFFIGCTPEGMTPTQAQWWRLHTYGYNKGWEALYYPWIKIADPITNLIRNFPPGGHIAGIYANNDVLKNIGHAPGGMERGTLNFCAGVERKLEWRELALLSPSEINPIIDMPETGRVVWGVDTMERPAADYKYIHSRRMVSWLRMVIFASTHGFVFENAGKSLWSRIKTFADSFLGNLYKNNYFGGETPSQAFFVICDDSNNSIDSEYVYCDIGIRPHKVAKFIVFRITQISDGSV